MSRNKHAGTEASWRAYADGMSAMVFVLLALFIAKPAPPAATSGCAPEDIECRGAEAVSTLFKALERCSMDAPGARWERGADPEVLSVYCESGSSFGSCGATPASNDACSPKKLMTCFAEQLQLVPQDLLPTVRISFEGHADPSPVANGAQCDGKNNWDLSANRATALRDALHAALIEPERAATKGTRVKNMRVVAFGASAPSQKIVCEYGGGNALTPRLCATWARGGEQGLCETLLGQPSGSTYPDPIQCESKRAMWLQFLAACRHESNDPGACEPWARYYRGGPLPNGLPPTTKPNNLNPLFARLRRVDVRLDFTPTKQEKDDHELQPHQAE